MTNLADLEWQTDATWADHDIDRPTLAECVADEAMCRPDSNMRTCVAAWVSHDYAAWLACDSCQGRAA